MKKKEKAGLDRETPFIMPFVVPCIDKSPLGRNSRKLGPTSLFFYKGSVIDSDQAKYDCFYIQKDKSVVKQRLHVTLLSSWEAVC